ncbi:MAG: histidine ammonia-lyase [Schleiferiaceae bacterium]|jgi:histidine ammonia-lyase|nr:histidine ammonia-lyase [Schleiferiaceae bacterium]
MDVHHIKPNHVTLENLSEIIAEQKDLALSQEAAAVIDHCREYVDNTMKERTAPVYGINTGFGSLCDVKINESELEKLQKNLVMSHACGTGEEVPQEIVKLMLLLKAKGLSYGKSGVQKITVERLITFYNEDCIPVVYQLGSLGASGDLAPLAHLSLPLLGLGEVNLKGERMEASEALNILGLEPIALKSKEGLALLNGTQFMSSFGTWSVLKAKKLSYLADLIGSISLEAFDGRPEAFDELLHLIRPHNGQIETAKNIREFLEGSELMARHKEHVQDPYSFRCMPQVHGASKDAIGYAAKVMETEINSVTDNPTVFDDEDKILSGGNFHGQPLALAMDFLAIALAELGNISERRTYQLIHGRRGLNPFLVAEPGLNSGFMIPQYTAASIVSQNKQLATPASVDSIESSNGQEDHVSMGANAATKLYQVVNNLERILAIELMNASQALHFRNGKSSEFIESFVTTFREEVPFVEEDRILHNDIEAAITFIQSLDIDSELIFK